MKKIILIAIAIFCSATLNAQTIQNGIVEEYRETLKKRPLGGVELIVTNAPSTVSDKKGKYRLEFQTMKAGQRVNVRRIEKIGYEIFNKEALEQWNINPQEPFIVVMVRSDRFKKIRDTYSQVSSASYAKQLELDKQALDAERQAGKLTEEQLRTELIKLQEEYDRKLENLDNYIDRFARIDLTNLTKTEQEIIDLVQNGKIEVAIERYEELDLMTKWLKEKNDIDKLESVKNELNKAIQGKNHNIEMIKASLSRYIQTLRLAGGRDNFHKAGILLKQMALIDSTNIDIVSEYAHFARDQHQYEDAVQFFTRCTQIGTLIEQVKFTAEIGLIYLETRDFTRAQDMLSLAKGKFDLIDSDSLENVEIHTSIHIGLGNLYAQMGQFEKAIPFYQEVIDRHNYFANGENLDFNKELATTFMNLGNVYDGLNMVDKSIEMYLLALNMFELKENQFQKEIGLCHNNIGGAYSDKMNDYINAKIHFEKAMAVFEKQSEYNPKSYLPYLAFVLSNIGSMHLRFNNYEEAEQNCIRAMEIYNSLFKERPNQYLADYMHINTILGSVYSSMGKFVEAEKRYKETLNLVNNVPLEYIEYYRHNIWLINIDLAILYIQTEEYPKAQQLLEHTTNHSYLLSSQYNNSHYYHRNLELLVYCNMQMRMYDDALSNVDKMIDLQPNNANNYDIKGEILLMKGNIDGAQKMWKKVIELDPKFLETNKSVVYEQLKAKGIKL